MNGNKWSISDADIDRIVGNLLRVGVIVSSLIVLTVLLFGLVGGGK